MSVKVENRPENRFTTFQALEKLQTEAIKTYKLLVSDSAISQDVKLFKNDFIHNLCFARAELLSANACNVYDQIEYEFRVKHLNACISSLNLLKSIFETIVLFEDIAGDNRLRNIFLALDETINKAKRLKESDCIRHNKGEKQVKKEYKEAKMKNFYHSEICDNSKIDSKLYAIKDPFDVIEAITKK